MSLRSNLPPGAFAEKSPLGGIPTVAIPYTIPAFVGSSLGSGAVILGESITHVTGGLDPLDNVASGALNTLISVDRVSDRLDGVANYFEGRHYQLTDGMIDWSIRPKLSNPALDVPIVESITAGLVSGTYYYVATARNNATGQSNWVTGMNFVSARITTHRGTIKVGWEAIDNARDYRVYRAASLTPGGYPDFTAASGGLLATVNGATQYLDTGLVGVVAGTDPPAANTANDEPDGPYEADYTYRQFQFNTPKKYRSLEDVIRDHGFGSQLSRMAEVAMSTVPGRGNGAPAVWLTAAGDPDDPMQAPGYSHYQTALTGLSTILDDHLILVVGATTPNIRQQIKQYVDTESNLPNKREKRAFVYTDPDTDIGSENVSTSILGIADAMFHERVCVVAPDSGAFDCELQDATTGTRVRQDASHEYLAAMVAGKLAALLDPAEPLTRKPIIGPITFKGNRQYNPQEMLDLRSGGVLVVDYRGESDWNVFQGVTTKTDNQDQFELSVGMASDVLAFAWRDAIDPRTSGSAQASLIGSKLTPGLLDAVKQRTILVLDRLANEGIIAGYDKQSILVAQDVSVKTRVNVTFTYQPIFPVNTVILTFATSFTLQG